MVQYYKTSGGYFYKKYKNGEIKRVSSEIYKKNVMKGGAGGGGGEGGGGGGGGGGEAGGDGSANNKLLKKDYDFFILSPNQVYSRLAKKIFEIEGYDENFDKFITEPRNNKATLLICRNKCPSDFKGVIHQVSNTTGITDDDVRAIIQLLRDNSTVNTIIFDLDTILNIDIETYEIKGQTCMRIFNSIRKNRNNTNNQHFERRINDLLKYIYGIIPANKRIQVNQYPVDRYLYYFTLVPNSLREFLINFDVNVPDMNAIKIKKIAKLIEFKSSWGPASHYMYWFDHYKNYLILSGQIEY